MKIHRGPAAVIGGIGRNCHCPFRSSRIGGREGAVEHRVGINHESADPALRKPEDLPVSVIVVQVPRAWVLNVCLPGIRFGLAICRPVGSFFFW